MNALTRSGSRRKLYGPLLVLLLGQALFVTLMPSTGADDDLAPGAANVAGGAAGGAGSEFDPSAPGVGADGETAGSESGGPGGAGGSGAGGAGGSLGVPTSGDTSHCHNGLQTDVITHAPPCVPAFTGSNGGATSQGVTATEIKLTALKVEGDPQVDALLEAAGVNDSPEEITAFIDAGVKFINERFELYGRKIVVDHYESQCPSVPDEDGCRASVDDIIRKKPFALQWPDYAYPELLGVLADAGIVAFDLGGFDGSHYQRFAPFRWSYGMDGALAAAATADYYCKTMAGGTATNAGTQIHATIGDRNTPRRVGIISPEYGALYAVGDRLRSLLKKQCGIEVTDIYTYDFNTENLGQRGLAITSSLIRDKVTTVIWAAEGGGPIFFTPVMTSQGYYPEHLLAGGSLLDIDAIGRLMDQEQWSHAFGISPSPRPQPRFESEAADVWKVSGPDQPYDCAQCPIYWADLRTIGTLIQMAGPNLTPSTFAQGALTLGPLGGWAASGGDPTNELVEFGPDDHTAISDFAEIWWDPTATSSEDGSGGGAFVMIDGGRRYRLGEYPARRLPVPPAAT